MFKESMNNVILEFKKQHKDRKINIIYDGGDKYLLHTSPKKLDSNSINVDPYYICKKNSNKFISFLPITNKDWYKKTRKNIVWENKE